MKQSFYLSAIAICISGMLSAQQFTKQSIQKPNTYKANYFDVSVTMGIPMDEFSNTTTSLPFGLTFNYLHQPSTRSPILFGGGLTYLSAGSKTIKQTLSADIKVGNTVIDQLNIPLEFRVGNSILNGHAMMRIQAHSETIKPYFDLLAGFNYLWTSTSLYDRSNQNYFQSKNNNNLIYSKNQQSSITWSAGAGAGIQARLGKNTYLNIGANYMLGGSVKYFDRNQVKNWDIQLNPSAAANAYTEGTLTENDISVNAIPKRSFTNMLMANAGVTVIIGNASK
jgi:hypothetical protein